MGNQGIRKQIPGATTWKWIDSARLLCYNPIRVKTRAIRKEEV